MRVILFLVGFGFSIIGFIYIIVYLNYLTIGYDLINYFGFIVTRIECLLAPIGLLLIILAIFKKGKNNVLRLWYSIKF